MKTKKYAILSMDIEDWYHLDYYSKFQLDKTKSMLDGLTNYIDLLNQHNIKTTFFTLSELSEVAKEQILFASASGHEIACHGKTHIRPVLQDVKKFEYDLMEAKDTLSNITGKEIIGYRAPCYSIDRDHYEAVRRSGFLYSSSKMDVSDHPLYGELDLSDYNQPMKSVFYKDGFYEFSLSTKKFMGKDIAISGGGWIRIFPWRIFMKRLIASYLKAAQVYVLYIHPFELSKQKLPKVEGSPFLVNMRANTGLGKVLPKVEQLIQILKENGYEMITFQDAIKLLQD